MAMDSTTWNWAPIPDNGKTFLRLIYSAFGLRISLIQQISALGSCDRASWAKYEDRKPNKMQQLDV